MEKEDILESLQTESIEVRECILLRGRSDIPYSYLISVPIATQISDIEKVKKNDNIQVSYETYSKRNNWAQCYSSLDMGKRPVIAWQDV